MSSMDFSGLLDIDLNPVESINERRGGWSGVYVLENPSGNLYMKRQSNHYFRSILGLRTPTLKREVSNYRKFAELGIPTPRVLLYAQQGDCAIMITSEQPGIPLRAWLRDLPASEERESIMRRLAELLFTMHSHHFTHGCLYEKHILIDSDNQKNPVSMIDLEKARFCFLNRHGAVKDLSRLFRYTPEFSAKDQAILTELHEHHWPGFKAQLSARVCADMAERARSRAHRFA